LKEEDDTNARFSLRRSDICLILLGISAALLGTMFIQAHFQRFSDASQLMHMTAEVRKLQLTDLCLFTEARYTRHLSQTDLYSAFQDHPAALEHFPAGSIAPPPQGIGGSYGTLD
jgi:hypothetical protein